MKLNHDCIFYICQYLSPVDRLSVFKADEDLEYIVKTSWNFKTLRVVIGKTLQDCGLIYSVQRLPLKNFQTILKLAEGRTRNLIIYDKTFWNPKSAIIVSFDSHCYVLTNYNSVEEVISLLASRFCRLKQLYLSCNMTRSTFVNSLLKMNTQLEEFTFALECDLTISIDLTLVSKTIHSLSLKFIDLNARQGLDEVFKRLKNLYLEDIVGFDDGLLSEICQYATQLKTLNLQSFDVPVTLRLNSLNKNLPLQNLECFYLSGEGFDLQDRNLIEIAANCPKLRCLELGYCQFSDQALSTALVYLENLEVLYLFSCDRLTQIKLESSLKKMKTLKLLSLSKSVIENISTTMMKTPLLYQLYLDCGDDPVPEFVVRQVIEMSTARMQTFIMRNARMNQELVVYKVGEVDWYEYRADRKPTFCVDSFYMENSLLKNLANFVTNTLPDRKALLFEGSSVVINGVPAVSYTNF